MAFAEAIEKIARNEPLTPQELQTLRDEAKAIEEIKNLVKSWVIPGSSTPFIQNLQASNIFVPSGEIRLGEPAPGQGFDGVRIAKPAFEYDGELWNIAGVEDDTLQVGIRASDGVLVAGGGDVTLSNTGVTFLNQEGNLTFESTGGSVDDIIIYSDAGDLLVFKNAVGGKGVFFDIDTTTHELIGPYIGEDTGQAERALAHFPPGENGSRAIVGDGGTGVWIDGYGSSSGWTGVSMYESANTPANPSQDTQGRIYFKDNKIIFQWNDGGTVRYKYLDLTGTTVTWTHTTTPP